MSGREVEVAVIGGGPAGCAAAIVLARCGHGVTLVTKSTTRRVPLGESIPPSTRKLFDLLGVSAAIDAANFVRSTGNTVWWGRDTPRVEHFADGARGWQVTNVALEAVLRDAAVSSGVRLLTERAAADTTRLTDAAFVLDCSGRTGVFARHRHLRVPESTVTTIALVGLWTASGFETPDPTHTLIQSYEGGWAWSVPAAIGADQSAASHRFVAVMIDPRRSDRERTSASRQVYLAELRKAAALSRTLRDARFIEGPRGWDASMYHAARYVDEHILLVGDAGSFIDPLSSAGVKKALASGWLAAVATHTSLVRPEMRPTALDFFNAREHEVYQSFRAMTESYWRDAASWHAHPFWSDRAPATESSLPGATLAESYQRLRSAAQLSVCLNPAVTIAPRPAVSGTEIVLEERLVRADQSAGARYAYDVDLVALVSLAPRHDSVPAVFEAYNARYAPVALPDFLAALATAIAERWLLWCDT